MSPKSDAIPDSEILRQPLHLLPIQIVNGLLKLGQPLLEPLVYQFLQ